MNLLLEIKLSSQVTHINTGIVAKVVRVADKIKRWDDGNVISQRIKIICFNFVLSAAISTPSNKELAAI